MVTVLKLGGSVITEKATERTVDDVALERIASVLSDQDTTGLLVVIGGGSFGHPVANEHGLSTAEGTHDPAAIAQVHAAMLDLITQVVDRLIDAGVDAVPFHPLSLAHRNGAVLSLAVGSIEAALEEGFVPVLHGDGVVTVDQGVTILSGDEIVVELARSFDADRVGLCTGVAGVLDEEGTVVERIDQFEAVSSFVGESDATDVTGGMAGKVQALLELGVPANVFDLDGLSAFLDGDQPGTTIGGRPR